MQNKKQNIINIENSSNEIEQIINFLINKDYVSFDNFFNSNNHIELKKLKEFSFKDLNLKHNKFDDILNKIETSINNGENIILFNDVSSFNNTYFEVIKIIN